MAATEATGAIEPTKDLPETEKGNGLVVHLFQYAFYSQKVIMALVEKKLPFKIQTVDITKGQQYDEAFLKLNPRGEVPVLVDGAKIIPDSSKIIEYLDDNYSNDDSPRLMPSDNENELKQKVEHFNSIIGSLPADLITMGAFRYPEIAPNPKLPFVAPVQRTLLASDEKMGETLKAVAEKHPESKDVLLKKAEMHEACRNKIATKEGFESLVSDVNNVLDEVEKELELHKDDKSMWLCSQRFTVADIALAILLTRLYQVGLESKLFNNNEKPNLFDYFQRVKKRQSYKKAIPNFMFHVKTFFKDAFSLFKR